MKNIAEEKKNVPKKYLRSMQIAHDKLSLKNGEDILLCCATTCNRYICGLAPTCQIRCGNHSNFQPPTSTTNLHLLHLRLTYTFDNVLCIWFWGDSSYNTVMHQVNIRMYIYVYTMYKYIEYSKRCHILQQVRDCIISMYILYIHFIF